MNGELKNMTYSTLSSVTLEFKDFQEYFQRLLKDLSGTIVHILKDTSVHH